MNRIYHSGHVPVRVPAGWTEQSRAMVIQINGLFDDLYREIARLRKELEELKTGDDSDGTDNESAP